jgi:hypothetical protein
MTAAPADRTASPAWAEFVASPGATVAAVAAIAGLALNALQIDSGVAAGLAPEVRTGQFLLTVVAAIAAYMLWAPSLARETESALPSPDSVPMDRLHTLASGGRIHCRMDTQMELVPFGSGQAWVRTRR